VSNVENYPLFGQRFTSHCQNECSVVGNFWKPYIVRAVGGELGLIHTYCEDDNGSSCQIVG
jgi:hypothetical protein